MKAKLLSHGPRIFDTYELLEMLLYYVIPYRDTNPIAKRLLSRFGSLDAVLSAQEGELLAVDGIGATSARMLTAVGRAERIREIDLDISSSKYINRTDAGEFLVKYFGEHKDANIALMLLDNSLRLMRAVPVSGSSFSSGSVQTKDFVSVALEVGASAAIIGYTYRGMTAFPHDV